MGLQAQSRRAPWMSVALTVVASLYWLVHAIFFATVSMWVFTLVSLAMTVGFAILLALAVGARREMRRDPPPRDLEVLPADYKVPYSHYHEDPPEVRLSTPQAARYVAAIRGAVH